MVAEAEYTDLDELENEEVEEDVVEEEELEEPETDELEEEEEGEGEEEEPRRPSRDEELAHLKAKMDSLIREKEMEDEARRAAASQTSQEEWRQRLDQEDKAFLKYFADCIKGDRPDEAIQALRNAGRYEAAVIAQQIAEQTIQQAFGQVFSPAMSREEFLNVPELSDVHDLVDVAMRLDKLQVPRSEIIQTLRAMKAQVTGKKQTDAPARPRPRPTENPRAGSGKPGRRRTSEKELRGKMRSAWKDTFGIKD